MINYIFRVLDYFKEIFNIDNYQLPIFSPLKLVDILSQISGSALIGSKFVFDKVVDRALCQELLVYLSPYNVQLIHIGVPARVPKSFPVTVHSFSPHDA